MRVKVKAELALRAIGAAVIAVPVVGGLATVMALTGAGLGVFLAIPIADYLNEVTASARMTWGTLGLGLLVGTIGFLSIWAWGVHAERREGRERLLADATSPSAEQEWVVGTVRRLSRQAAVVAPEVLIVEANTPLAYTVPRSGLPTLVVSTGTIETLPDEELEAVLAHELAHLANGDLRLMGWVVTPLVAAEEFVDTHLEPDPRAIPFLALGLWHELWARIAVGLFSRGREFAADRAAATLTGDPAALALALKRLDVTIAETPSEDLRQPDRSTDALSILPALDPDDDGGGGLLATHPATEDRIDRLRTLVREQEGA